MTTLDRRTFVAGAAAGAALLTVPRSVAHGARAAELGPVYAEVERRSAEAVVRLQDWIREPAIYAERRRLAEGAEHMARLCREAGFQQVEVIPTPGASAVFARLDAGAKRTLALYFMYDVKQVNEREWASPPFAARLVDLPEMGKVVMGRGAVNQKGPEAAFLAALHAIRGAGRKLPVNLVLIAEGEEEDGSPHLPDVVRRPSVRDALTACQGMMMPSPSQNLDGTIEVTLGAKGVVEVELVASGERWGRGPSGRDVHSGARPVVDSPPVHLVQALASLVGADGNEPAIDGLAAMVRPLSERERGFIADAARRLDESTVKKELGVTRWAGDVSFEEALARLAGRPTVNIQGLFSGYTGPGGKTILPHEARAKLDLRLVPDMTARGVLAALRAHLDRRGFGDVEVIDNNSYDPCTSPFDSTPVRAAMAVYRRAGVEPLVSPRMGGSWPGYLFTEEPLALPAVHFGLGYGQGAHSRDEFFVVEPARGAKVGGLAAAVRSYVDFLYEFASA